MSSQEVANQLNESQLEKRTNGLFGLIIGVALKYGLPSICCAWLFYVIWQKDLIIYNLAREVTTALVESNQVGRDNAHAIQELADSMRDKNP